MERQEGQLRLKKNQGALRIHAVWLPLLTGGPVFFLKPPSPNTLRTSPSACPCSRLLECDRFVASLRIFLAVSSVRAPKRSLQVPVGAALILGAVGHARVRDQLEGVHVVARRAQRHALAPPPARILPHGSAVFLAAWAAGGEAWGIVPESNMQQGKKNKRKGREGRAGLSCGREAHARNGVAAKVAHPWREAVKRARERVVLAVRAKKAQAVVCGALCARGRGNTKGVSAGTVGRSPPPPQKAGRGVQWCTSVAFRPG